MNFNQSGINTKLEFNLKKYSEDNKYFFIPNIETIFDNSEFIWNSSLNVLNFYWTHYFKKHGTCLQDFVSTSNDPQMTYHNYLINTIHKIVSNNFDGVINVDSVDEDDTSWNITSSVPPSTLLSCLRYTPWKIVKKDVINSFIIYQIVSAVEELHLSQIPHLGLTLDNIFLDENYNVKINLPRLDVLSERVQKLSCTDDEPEKKNSLAEDLNTVLWKWMYGEISNLDYLLYLNKLAGRTKSDPNNYLMIPWVTDFSELYGGFRDLKISKFRINKGDEHLDKIYEDQKFELAQYNNSCPLDFNIQSENHKKFSSAKSRVSKQFFTVIENDGIAMENIPSNPHHVSDILSELSYYAYMARVTPIDVLKKHYRSFYNPQEFRWDMAKMYAWSPDECIPQFFTDPNIFRSTHSDMPDIGLPEWCKTPEEFVKYHRDVLESERISSELNHWIDLVFGYKLLGDDAISAKNVHRQFTEKNSTLIHNGLTVLFRKPHPKRLCCNRNIITYFGVRRPNENYSVDMTSPSSKNYISLPQDYDPYELIHCYKSYSTFIQDSCTTSALELKPTRIKTESILRSSKEEDVINICCLIVELFNADKLRSDYLLPQTTVTSRIHSCSLLFNEEPTRIPLAFRDSVEKVLDSTTKRTYIPTIDEMKRSEKGFVFDKHVVKTFEFIKYIGPPYIDTVIALKHFFLSQYGMTKFNNEHLTIITPHLVFLLNLDLQLYFDQVLDILVCILHRFGLIACRNQLIRDILPHVIKLYPISKNQVISKHALLYQRNFLNLLLIRIGMNAFLNHMTGLLVNMLVIGQHMSGSMKESPVPDTELKQYDNDSESINSDEKPSIWNIHQDDENCVHDYRVFQLDAFDDDCQSLDVPFTPPELDSLSQCGIDIEESKNPMTVGNGGIPNSLPDILGLLPLSDYETEEILQVPNKNRNGSFTQLLTSPFKKRSDKSNKTSKTLTTKVLKRKILSQDCSKMSLAQLSHSSLIWLSDLVGPIEASSKILSELLAQFSLCYQNCNFDEVPKELLDENECSLVTGTYDSVVQADRDVCTVLDCLKDFIGLYGLAVVWHQIRHFFDIILDKSKILTDDMLPDAEMSLICSLSLLKFLSMLIPDDYLDTFLFDKVLDEYLPLIIRTIGNMSKPFPSGIRPRQVLLHKVIDLIYLLSSRLKFDQIKDTMNNIYKLLFGLFSKTFDCNEQGVVIYREVPIDVIDSTIKETTNPLFLVNFMYDNNDFTILASNSPKEVLPRNDYNTSSVSDYRTVSSIHRESAFEEMKSVLTAELAYALYISFAKLMGQNKLDSLICNQSLIQALMVHHDLHKTVSSYSTPDKTRQSKLEKSLHCLMNSVMAHKRRHLTDLWNEYWIYELGFCDSAKFDIKQMCLGKFEGHTSIVKGFDILNCENGFLSYSKDKIVKLYSIADIDYSNLSTEVPSKFSYIHHKPVSEAIFIEQMRMAVSVDGSVHLWDPFIGKKIFHSSFGATVPNWNVVCSISPAQSQIAVANSDNRVHIVDLRSGSTSYSYNLNPINNTSPSSNDFSTNLGGFIRKICATPDGNHLIVGNSDGFANMIDLRMCRLMTTWRPHQNDISQIAFMKNWCITSSLEANGHISMLNMSNLNQSRNLYGQELGAIHSLMILRDQILVGGSQNRFGLFETINQYSSLQRLSSSVFKGTVSTASLLLHNRLLLLGNEMGNISLWY